MPVKPPQRVLKRIRGASADADFCECDLHEPAHVQHVHPDLGRIPDGDQSILRTELHQPMAKVRPYIFKDKGSRKGEGLILCLALNCWSREDECNYMKRLFSYLVACVGICSVA